MSKEDGTLDIVTELAMKVAGLLRREKDYQQKATDLEEAVKLLNSEIGVIKEEDLNRDVRLSLIEGRLDGVDKG